MRLSRQSISYILRLQKSRRPDICYYSSEENSRYINKMINVFNDIKKKEQQVEEFQHKITKKCEGVFISTDVVNDEEILEIEKKLMRVSRDTSICIEIDKINSSIDKRNLVLNILSRHHIDIIKGTEEEIYELVKAQSCYDSDYIEGKKYNNYRSFAKKNDVILVILDKKYYITDGYSEFSIKSDINILDSEILRYILGYMISVGIASCNKKEEKIQSILISIIAFYKAYEITKKKLINYINVNSLEKYIIDNIEGVTIDDIASFQNINYSFRR